MQVSEEKLTSWNKYRQHGDITKLAELTGKSRGTIWEILNSGEGMVEDIEIVDNFFRGRIQKVEKIQNPNQ